MASLSGFISAHTIGMNDGFDPTQVESSTLRIFGDREERNGTTPYAALSDKNFG
jgi:hypothetical protein